MIATLLVLLALTLQPAALYGPGWELAIQPQACPMCVTADAEAASLFLRPWNEAGAVGLLAHNYLAGSRFAALEAGDSLHLDYPGRRVYYEVAAVHAYRGRGELMGPGGGHYSEAQIYEREYLPGALTLQTCIGDRQGFLFVQARPVIPARVSVTEQVRAE